MKGRLSKGFVEDKGRTEIRTRWTGLKGWIYRYLRKLFHS